MLENNNQDRYYCSFCGSNLPEGFVEKLKKNSGVLICEQCGAEITKENFNTHESLIEVEEKEACDDNSILEVKHEAGLEGYSRVERYCLEMRSFMCRRIYDFFKKIKYSIRVYEEKGLDSFQLNVLARDFRKRLKKTSFQVKWINDPISGSFDEYLKFFQTFQAHLRYKKVYRTQYLAFIRDSLQLVMGLIVGRIQGSSLSGIDREIYDDLKRYSCFIVNDDARDYFKYNLTIFLSWYIYRRTKNPSIDRNFIKSDGTLSEGQVTTLANVIKRFLKGELLKQKLKNKFQGADKRKFKKNFTEFQYLLKNDKIYRDMVFDYSYWLIRVVLDLIRGKYSSSELSGIKLEVLKHLKCRKLFVKDWSLSVEFKRNILIVLSRVINLNFKKLEKSSGLKTSQMMLKESAINALVSGLKTRIANKDEINGNFLGNLKDITLLDFRSEYERFQSNLKSNWIYSESFSLDLRNLISDVFRLISEPPDRSSLNNYEKALLDDLVAYNLDAFLSEKDGEKREKVKASSEKQKKPLKNKKKEYLRTYWSEWEIYLVESIEKAKKEDISSETKNELIEIIKQYRKFRGLYRNLKTLLEKDSVNNLERNQIHELKKKLEKMTPLQVSMFKKLKAYQEFYKENIGWHEGRVRVEINKLTKFLAEKLENLSQKVRANSLVSDESTIGRNIVNAEKQRQVERAGKESKKKLYSYKDIEFWIKIFKMKYYGGSWPKVREYVLRHNKSEGTNFAIPPYSNNMSPIVKNYLLRKGQDYAKLLNTYGDNKTRSPRTDEEILRYIELYENPEIGGSVPRVRAYIKENTNKKPLGETTIRRDIKHFFDDGKYLQYKGDEITYDEWLKANKKQYVRRHIPLDQKSQANEYVLLYNKEKNIYKLCTVNTIRGNRFVHSINDNLRVKESNINIVRKLTKQKSLEIICKHGSIIIFPTQSLFTVDDNCRLEKVFGNNIRIGMPILIPRFFDVNVNYEPLDLGQCGKIITKSGTKYVGQFKTIAYRYIEKTFALGEILGQYAAEGTMATETRPTTIITTSIDRDNVVRITQKLRELFGLPFSIREARINKCKNCGARTIERDNINSCPECEATYHTSYISSTKTHLARCIFNTGLGLKPMYSYMKEIPLLLYNAPIDCVRGFIYGYFKGDGSVRHYYDKNKNFSLNFETSSRRLAFGLNFLLKRIGIIASISQHNPPVNRPNSHLMYSCNIYGSSNLQILKEFLEPLPKFNFRRAALKTSVNTQVFLRQLNKELKEGLGVSLRDLYTKGIVPKNAVYVANQVARRANLSEPLMLKMLDGLKKNDLMTPIARRMERIFRNNTFTHVKKINIIGERNITYEISTSGMAYCAGTAFIYVESENPKNKKIKKKII